MLVTGPLERCDRVKDGNKPPKLLCTLWLGSVDAFNYPCAAVSSVTSKPAVLWLKTS